MNHDKVMKDKPQHKANCQKPPQVQLTSATSILGLLRLMTEKDKPPLRQAQIAQINLIEHIGSLRHRLPL